MDLIAPEFHEVVLAHRAQIHNGRQEFDCKLIRKDQRVIDVNIKTSEIVLDGARYIQSSFIDITDRKTTEENRSRMQRLEALGILAAGIAHEFNNLHMGIYGYIDCALTKTENAEVTAHLEKALSSIDRARLLTSRLITFSKGGAPALQCASVFPFIDEVLKSTVEGSGIRCSITVASDLGCCLYDPAQLRQVLQAMACNAMDSMPEGGDLLVSAMNKSLSKSNRMNLPEGDYVRIAIADNGVGIPEISLPGIFNPFFSTKPKGSGLNLAIAHSVLGRHGGGIEVASTVGRGTTFNLYLKACIKQ
jgi:signal transduction histidine kinase